MLIRVVSNDTCTLSGERSARRAIGASIGSGRKVGQPTKVQRCGAKTLSVSGAETIAPDECRPPKLQFGNIVGAVIIRLIGAVLLEQNDEWQLQHRSMQIEAMAELTPPALDADPARLPPVAA